MPEHFRKFAKIFERKVQECIIWAYLKKYFINPAVSFRACWKNTNGWGTKIYIMNGVTLLKLWHLWIIESASHSEMSIATITFTLPHHLIIYFLRLKNFAFGLFDMF